MTVQDNGDEYRVSVETEPCPHCKRGAIYTVVDSSDTGIGISWGGPADDAAAKQHAEDIADMLNDAFLRGITAEEVEDVS